nr:PQQ-binding-like beta-propeller repeat protein [Haloarcula sp. CK38]
MSERWRLGFGHALYDPVLSDGTVFLSTDEFSTAAVDAATGERQWERDVPGRVRAVDDGRVYVTSRAEDSGGGFVFALDADTGETQWTRQDAEDAVNGLQVADGRVYAAIGNTVERLDATRGNRRLLAEVDGEVIGLAVVDGTVYASGQRHFGTSPQTPRLWVRAFDADSGAEKWAFSQESHPPTRPSVADGTVYVGSDSHAIHAIDASDGSERWTAELGSAVRGLAAVPDDAADAVSGTVYAGCGDYYLYAFDAENGDRRWRTRTRGAVNTPAVAGDVVYAANRGYIIETNDDGSVRHDEDGSIDRDKAVHGFDGGSGEVLWTVELDSQVADGTTPSYFGGEPIVADGTVYVTTNASDGTFTLYAIGGATAQGGATPTRTAQSTGADGSGFTAVAAALGLVGAAGWQQWRRGDDRG